VIEILKLDKKNVITIYNMLYSLSKLTEFGYHLFLKHQDFSFNAFFNWQKNPILQSIS